MTAYFYACSSGYLKALKLLQPYRREYSELGEMLDYASWRAHADIIEYLVHIGAPVNDDETGASTALGACLRCLAYEPREPSSVAVAEAAGMTHPWSAPRARRAVRFLAERGAKWGVTTPVGRTSFPEMQRILVGLPPEVASETLEVLIANGACPDDAAEGLLETLRRQKRTRDHLTFCERLLRTPASRRKRMGQKRALENQAPLPRRT